MNMKISRKSYRDKYLYVIFLLDFEWKDKVQGFYWLKLLPHLSIYYFSTSESLKNKQTIKHTKKTENK